MKTSVGLVLHTNQKILVCHSTGNNFWDLPKGEHHDLSQAYIITCMREVLEETGINITPFLPKVRDIGEHDYIRGKSLYLFALKLPQIIPMNK